MSIFNNILEKLGIKKPAPPAISAKPVAPSAPSRAVRPGQVAPKAAGRPVFTRNAPYIAPVPAKPVEMPMVDVVAKLDALAKASSIQLNWKVSINDLMALLGMDHSAAAIKELAVELGCPESALSDSYKRNVWTHKTLLKKIAENGGNIPQSLLH